MPSPSWWRQNFMYTFEYLVPHLVSFLYLVVQRKFLASKCRSKGLYKLSIIYKYLQLDSKHCWLKMWGNSMLNFIYCFHKPMLSNLQPIVVDTNYMSMKLSGNTRITMMTHYFQSHFNPNLLCHLLLSGIWFMAFESRQFIAVYVSVTYVLIGDFRTNNLFLIYSLMVLAPVCWVLSSCVFNHYQWVRLLKIVMQIDLWCSFLS